MYIYHFIIFELDLYMTTSIEKFYPYCNFIGPGGVTFNTERLGLTSDGRIHASTVYYPTKKSDRVR